MVESPGLSKSAVVVFSPVIHHLPPAPSLPAPPFLLLDTATKTSPLPPGPQAPLDPFSDLGDGLLFLFGEQLVSGFALLSNAALASSPAIGLPATLKPLSGPNIIPPPIPDEQIASVLLPSSSPSITSLLLAQGIPAPSTLLFSAVVKLLVPSLAISLPATLKPLSGPNIVPPLIPDEQIASVLLPSSNPSMTSLLLAQRIPALSTFLSSAVVKLLVPSPAIGPPATLEPLFGLDIVPPPTPGKETASVFLLLSSPSMTSSFLAQEIPTLSIFLSGAVVKLSIPLAIQSTSLIPLLNPPMEFPAQGGNQRQSTSISAPLLNPGLDPLERSANRSIIKPATNPNPITLHLNSLHDENIAGLLEALAKDTCDADEDVAAAGKKRTLAKDTCNADEDVATAGKKKTWRKVALLSDKDIVPAEKKEFGEREKYA